MLVTEAPGIDRQQRATQRVPERVAEAGLQRLDDEPRAELVDGLLRQGGALCDEHWLFLSGSTTIFEKPDCVDRPSVSTSSPRCRPCCGGEGCELVGVRTHLFLE